MTRPIFIDIDGTLTDSPKTQHGKAIAKRLDRVRLLLKEGVSVVIWSGGGTEYAQQFVKEHGLDGALAIGKPEIIVDDCPTIRPKGTMRIFNPDEFFEGTWEISSPK